VSKRKQRKRCPHVDVIGIYGDAINRCGGYRNFCRDCGRYLDGQVSISVDRQALISGRTDNDLAKELDYAGRQLGPGTAVCR